MWDAARGLLFFIQNLVENCRQRTGEEIILAPFTAKDRGRLLGHVFPGDRTAVAGDDLEKHLVVRVVDHGQTGADGGQNVHRGGEQTGQAGVDLDAAAGAEAEKARLAPQIGLADLPLLDQLGQRFDDLLRAPVTVTALGEHLVAGVNEALEHLHLVLHVRVDELGVDDLDAVDLLGKGHGKMTIAHRLEQCGQTGAQVALGFRPKGRGHRRDGVLVGNNQPVAVCKEHVGVGGKGLTAVIIGMIHGDRAQAAILLPFGKGRVLILLKIDGSVMDDQSADQDSIRLAEQFRIGLQIILEDDVDQFGIGCISRIALLGHQGNQIAARLGRKHLEQMAEGGGEQQDRIFVFQRRGRHQLEDRLLLVRIRGKKFREFSLLRTTGNKVGHEQVTGVDDLEEVEQVTLVAATDAGQQHWNHDVAEGGVVQFAALGHDGVGVGNGEVTGGLHPCGCGGPLEQGHAAIGDAAELGPNRRLQFIVLRLQLLHGPTVQGTIGYLVAVLIGDRMQVVDLPQHLGAAVIKCLQQSALFLCVEFVVLCLLNVGRQGKVTHQPIPGLLGTQGLVGEQTTCVPRIVLVQLQQQPQAVVHGLGIHVGNPGIGLGCLGLIVAQAHNGGEAVERQIDPHALDQEKGLGGTGIGTAHVVEHGKDAQRLTGGDAPDTDKGTEGAACIEPHLLDRIQAGNATLDIGGAQAGQGLEGEHLFIGEPLPGEPVEDLLGVLEVYPRKDADLAEDALGVIV